MKFFTRKKKPLTAEDLIRRAKIIEPLVEALCTDILRSYRSTLLANEITYIVPAVWGASPDTPLTNEQIKIHQKVKVTVEQVLKVMDLKKVEPDQEYAVGYLLRGMIIAKVAYQVEGLRYHLMALNNDSNRTAEDTSLLDLEAVGTA